MATRMVLRNLERQPVRSLLSVIGIAFAVAVLVVGLSFIDVMDQLINQQFVVRDAAGRDGELRRAAVGAARCTTCEHLPGVMDVEPMRSRAGRASRRAPHRARSPSPDCRRRRV